MINNKKCFTDENLSCLTRRKIHEFCISTGITAHMQVKKAVFRIRIRIRLPESGYARKDKNDEHKIL